MPKHAEMPLHPPSVQAEPAREHSPPPTAAFERGKPAAAHVHRAMLQANSGPRAIQLQAYQEQANQHGQPRPGMVLQAKLSGSGAVVQRVTATPASVTVLVDKDKVVAVLDADGASIPFMMLDKVTDPIAEGTAVVSPLTKAAPVVRFANDSTAAAGAVGLPKIRTVNKQAVEVVVSPSEASSSNSSAASSSGGPAPGLRADDIRTSPAGTASIFGAGMGLTAFEKSGQGDKGQEHYDKHGVEFSGVGSKADYIRSAQAMGRDTDPRFIEAQIKNTLVRFDPRTKAVLISNQKLIRTFYVWDQTFSDPVAYAIYYTITHNMKTGIDALDPRVLEKLHSAGHDMHAIQAEYLMHGFAAKKSLATLQSETHASIGTIDMVHREWLKRTAPAEGEQAQQEDALPHAEEDEEGKEEASAAVAKHEATGEGASLDE